MITIIDYGAGNIKSIKNMLKKLGVSSIVSNQADDILEADKLILPGVGHFDHGMKNLKNSGLVEVLEEKVTRKKTPLLGICLGAQLLGNKSEEGSESGLGWIPMKIKKFDGSRMTDRLKIPHMGWNQLQILEQNKSHPLLANLDDMARFYFVHTYHMLPDYEENVLATTTYGYSFASAVHFGNIYGVQFHPEKSHVFGMQLLKNFAHL